MAVYRCVTPRSLALPLIGSRDKMLPFSPHYFHERVYCNDGFAAATSLRTGLTVCRRAGSPFGSLDLLFQVCLGTSRLHAPVSLGDSAISSRTVMNNAG